MKNLSINLLKLFFVWSITVFLVASCSKPSYANDVQCKITELALTGYNINGVHSPHWAFFVRNISMHPHIYVELGRDIFGCAGYRLCQSVNPFKLHTNHLTVICEAPNLINGAH
ncbi:hypothetical protein QR665_00625 [Acinetobacter gerneri]|uniref:hypothetical protein n=1 Tax=Acinetobacter gerneri TaxID=202952 RepID=UPI0029361625|nr:hypothetical protein [Acinetobacter gerneri]MDV2438011.1 hypothetical protein [Acinetobacter gerneri]